MRRRAVRSCSSTFSFSIALALAGCFGAHVGEDSGEGGATPADSGSPPTEDAGELDDGGTVDGGAIVGDPCTTVCEPPSVLARVPLDLGFSRVPAVLDAVVHRDEVVVSLLVGAESDGSDPTPEFSLARISRRTGEARIESLDVPTSTASIGAAALASRGETLTLVAAHAASGPLTLQPEVLIVRWEGAGTPMVVEQRLTELPLPSCVGCFRRGVSVAIGVDGGLIALAGAEELFLGRVSLDTATIVRETIPLPSVVPNTAIDARADASGSALLTMGGLRETPGATPTPALAMIATDSTLAAPISLPGEPGDSVPHPWVHDGALEIVRFLHDDGFASGRLHRFAIEGSETVEVATITTAGDLPPLVLASTPSVLTWVESSLTAIGESDLRVLAPPPSTCERVSPVSVIHLPRPLAGWDPRVMVATEADGRTYVALLEQDPGSSDTAMLVVFDLGVCRATT